MPPQNTHEIFRKELELFREKCEIYDKDGGFLAYSEDYHSQEINVDAIESFLIQSLRRSSLAVVEASVGEETVSNCEAGEKPWCNCEEISASNEHRGTTLATARTIVGEDNK